MLLSLSMATRPAHALSSVDNMTMFSTLYINACKGELHASTLMRELLLQVRRSDSNSLEDLLQVTHSTIMAMPACDIEVSPDDFKDALDELAQRLDEIKGMKTSDKEEPASEPLQSNVLGDKSSDSRALESIKTRVRKMWPSSSGKALRSTSSYPQAAPKKQLSYPFKEETLKDIQRAASEACANLSLALQVLQA